MPATTHAQRSSGAPIRAAPAPAAAGSAAGALRATALAPPAIEALAGRPGRPLDAALRAQWQPRVAIDLARVRVHDDAVADGAARAIDALAFTAGRDVAFAAGAYRPDSAAGRRLIAHELAHVAQGGSVVRRQPQRAAQPTDICFRPGEVRDEVPGECLPRRPEDCPLYDDWLASFTRLASFSARDTAPGGTATSGFPVLGDVAADPASADADDHPTGFVGSDPGDAFIDHPTDHWVRTCLPENLRRTAYQLPADCADIVVILRHVWLSAHRRTERHGDFELGDRAGGHRQRHIGGVIGDVFTGNLRTMVNAYTGADGRPLQTFRALAPRLHPGDILVWEHHDPDECGPRERGCRSGGHSFTIAGLERSGATIRRIVGMQGNQPLFDAQKAEIRAHVRAQGGRVPSADALGDSPGRRIEIGDLVEGEPEDPDGLILPDDLRDLPRRDIPGAAPDAEGDIWTWADGHTTLVAAGPPAAAVRTRAMRRSPLLGASADWLPLLRRAGGDELTPRVEAAMQALRSEIDAGAAPADADVRALATAIGERVWRLATTAGDLGNQSHFARLEALRALIAAFAGSAADPARAAAYARVFALVDDAVVIAARGGSGIDFSGGAGRRDRVVRILITGFDPFDSTGSLARPGPGEWNPSGAAALALDGRRLRVDDRLVAAIETVVLPVSFADFDTGLVERLVASAGADAVLTVSLDPNLASGDPVRLERYAVGTRSPGGGTAVPAAPGGSAGAAIIETNAPIDDIASGTARARRGRRAAIAQPTTGEDLTLAFASAAAGDAGLALLGLPAQGSARVVITDHAAIQRLIAAIPAGTVGPAITFTIGGTTASARVLRGPGGSFLSNEVSYRAQRALGTGTGAPWSFHTHVPGSDAIPADDGTRAGRRARATALDEATAVRTRLIATLERLAGATARELAERRP